MMRARAFDVRFYLVTLLFIIFDLEVAPVSLGGQPARDRCISDSGR